MQGVQRASSPYTATLAPASDATQASSRPWSMKRSCSFTESSSGNAANPTTQKGKDVEEAQDQDQWDVEKTMVTMDKRYGTKFVEWIQREENLECTASHLRGIASDYDVKKVANGLRWVVANWTIDNIALLLRLVTPDWPLDKASAVASLVSNDWPLKPYTSRLVVCIVHDMAPDAAVEYINVFTREWSIDSILELIADIAQKLHWRPEYSRHFALRFAWTLKATRNLDTYEINRLQLFCFGMPTDSTTNALSLPSAAVSPINNLHVQSSMHEEPMQMASASHDGFFSQAHTNMIVAQQTAFLSTSGATLVTGSTDQSATTRQFREMHAAHSTWGSQENISALDSINSNVQQSCGIPRRTPLTLSNMDICEPY